MQLPTDNVEQDLTPPPTTADLAKYFRVTEASVRRWVRSGRIPRCDAFKSPSGHRWYFRQLPRREQ